MNQYETYLRHVLTKGRYKTDRTGTGTLSTFGYQIRFDLAEGFPLVTTKKVHFKSIVTELLWFLRGDTNVKWLQEHGCTIWDEWARADGSLGPVYGKQWRDWSGKVSLHRSDVIHPLYANAYLVDEDNKGVVAFQERIDQLQDAITKLRTNPDDRRIIVSAWNVADIPDMALPPCHAFFQFYTEELTLTEREDLAAADEIPKYYMDENHVPTRRLSCQLYQRSCDSFLGVPFNIASYALLTHIIAAEVNMVAGDFVWTGGDCHIYNNHMEQVHQQLQRDPYPYPTLLFVNGVKKFDEYLPGDFDVDKYVHHPAIKAPVAV